MIESSLNKTFCCALEKIQALPSLLIVHFAFVTGKYILSGPGSLFLIQHPRHIR
jgi:hypothetical protein